MLAAMVQGVDRRAGKGKTRWGWTGIGFTTQGQGLGHGQEAWVGKGEDRA